MKKLVFIGILASFTFNFSFAQNTKGGNDTAAPKEQKKLKLEGIFESKKGVMHTISCHCYNVGFLKAKGQEYVVCFDRLPNSSDLDIDCKKISVEGVIESHSIDGSGGPCPADTENIFYVTKWKCK